MLQTVRLFLVPFFDLAGFKNRFVIVEVVF